MMPGMFATAVIVSRFDQPMGEILAPILACPLIDEILIVKGKDGIFERYEAAGRARNPIIYTVDDDCIVDPTPILAAHIAGKVTANMPTKPNHRADYSDGIALVGFGACFQRFMGNLSVDGSPFSRYMAAGFGFDELFMRECDRVFTALSSLNLVDIPKANTPAADAANRMGRERRHGADLQEIRRRIYDVRREESRKAGTKREKGTMASEH